MNCSSGSAPSGRLRGQRERSCFSCQHLLHSIQNRAYDSADHSSLDRFALNRWQVGLKSVRELRDRERLQPHAPRAGERGEKKAVAAEDHVLDSWHHRDLERDAGLERPNVSRMDSEGFAGLQVPSDELSGELKPGSALPAELLQQEAVATEDAGAERLLKSYADLNFRRTTQESVTVNHVFVARRN